MWLRSLSHTVGIRAEPESTLFPTGLHGDLASDRGPVPSHLWESHTKNRDSAGFGNTTSQQPKAFSRCFSLDVSKLILAMGILQRNYQKKPTKVKFSQVEYSMGNNLVSFSWLPQPYLNPWCNAKASRGTENTVFFFCFFFKRAILFLFLFFFNF